MGTSLRSSYNAFRWIPSFRRSSQFRQELLKVERIRHHRKLSIDIRPLLTRPIPIDLDAVIIGVAKVDGFANAVVGGSVDRDSSREDALESRRKRHAAGIQDRKVKEARCPRSRWRAALAFPDVK